MKRNPLIPFAFTAVIGIILIIGISFWGIHKQDEAKKAKEQAALNPDAIFKKNCASCHGEKLEGKVGPNLQKAGAKLSKADISNIIKNGKGGKMPAGVVKGEEAQIIAKWLSEKK
ncbi:cytochrome c-550 [Fictibacillus macauensis ZFHKF-1]|uniref:Cytochrome c-550 n=1 Tax=Fictibacillus macauensis ZFHKF-1 TaxID=1196324 RepID=I8UE66_9BACL|nr:cytochrome c [Fictibacillus macauensis]EIT85200.1 cytochrome c-550 [Fictibacillus macauensis ZFHKF-1]